MKYNAKTNERIYDMLNEAKGKKTSEFSPAVIKAIVAAMSERASEANHTKACEIVYYGLYKYAYSVVKRFTAINIEDYMQEFYFVVAENLPAWRPEKSSLITYFTPHLEKMCNMLQLKDQPFVSMHYRDAHISLSKVKSEMAVNGNTSPTDTEIHQALKEKGLRYSMKTIDEVRYQNVKILSLDAKNEDDTCLLDIIAADGMNDNQEDDEDELTAQAIVNRAIKKLNSTTQVIIKAEMNFYNTMDPKNRKKIRIKELQQEVQKYLGEVSIKWLKTEKDCAEREFWHMVKKEPGFAPYYKRLTGNAM